MILYCCLGFLHTIMYLLCFYSKMQCVERLLLAAAQSTAVHSEAEGVVLLLFLLGEYRFFCFVAIWTSMRRGCYRYLGLVISYIFFMCRLFNAECTQCH